MAIKLSPQEQNELDAINRQLDSLQTQARNLESYIATNRYSPADVRDAEQDLSHIENQIATLMARRTRLVATPKNQPKPQSQTIVQPYVARPVKPIPQPAQPSLFTQPTCAEDEFTPAQKAKLAQLRAEYRILEDKLDKLDERIFACEVNMDVCCRTQDLSRQAAMDKIDYQRECSEITKQMSAIAACIHELESRQH